MDIKIVGKDFDLGDSLRSHTEESMKNHIKKYFPNALSARISVSREGRVFHVDAIVNEGVMHGPFIKSTAKEEDIYVAVDSAISKITTKLRRYKRRLKDHKSSLNTNLKSYLHSYHDDTVVRSIPVKEEKMHIKHLSVEDAAMYLDLMSAPVIIFVNLESKKLNIMYKKDGEQLTLVDTDQCVVDNS